MQSLARTSNATPFDVTPGDTERLPFPIGSWSDQFQSERAVLRKCARAPVIDLRVGLNKVCGQCRFRCAHSPDVEIMHFRHTGQCHQEFFHFDRIDTRRNGGQGQVDGIAKQSPRANCDNDER